MRLYRDNGYITRKSFRENIQDGNQFKEHLYENKLSYDNGVVFIVSRKVQLTADEEAILKKYEQEIDEINTITDFDAFIDSIYTKDFTKKDLTYRRFIYALAYILFGTKIFTIDIYIPDIEDNDDTLKVTGKINLLLDTLYWYDDDNKSAKVKLIPKDFGLPYDADFGVSCEFGKNWYNTMTVSDFLDYCKRYNIKKGNDDAITYGHADGWYYTVDVTTEDVEMDGAQIICEPNAEDYIDQLMEKLNRQDYIHALLNKFLKLPFSKGLEDMVTDIINHCRIYIDNGGRNDREL